MLHEKSQIQERAHCMIPFILMSRKSKSEADDWLLKARWLGEVGRDTPTGITGY
jgi:hypothetical protein